MTLRLYVEAMGGATRLVHSGIVDVGISGVDATLPDIERTKADGVELIPITAPSHPLAGSGEHRREQRGIMLKLRLPIALHLQKGHDFFVFLVIGVRAWRLVDLGSKRALLLAGIGWGSMPEPMVRDDFAAGRLKQLNLSEWSGGFYAFHAIYRTDTPPGPTAAWVIRHFSQEAASEERQQRSASS